MKRTGFARAVYERRPPRLSVTPGLWRQPEPVGLSQPVPKDVPLRSEPYRRWVASLDCAMCKVTGRSQCAHANEGKGMGTKVCDSLTFPACGPHGLNMGCHQRIDLSFDMKREERRALEARLVAETQAKAIAAGWCLSTLTRKA